MRIEYELKYRDYLLFNTIHQLLSIPLQIIYVALSALISFLGFDENGLLISVIKTLFLYLIMWVFQLLFNIVYLYFGKNPSILTKHIVEIQDDAFYEETRFNRSYQYWSGIIKVVQYFGFIAIYINAHMAHIIPRRAFSSTEQRTQFLVALNEKLRK
jgi:hypothetical protein